MVGGSSYISGCLLPVEADNAVAYVANANATTCYRR